MGLQLQIEIVVGQVQTMGENPMQMVHTPDGLRAHLKTSSDPNVET